MAIKELELQFTFEQQDELLDNVHLAKHLLPSCEWYVIEQFSVDSDDVEESDKNLIVKMITEPTSNYAVFNHDGELLRYLTEDVKIYSLIIVDKEELLDVIKEEQY